LFDTEKTLAKEMVPAYFEGKEELQQQWLK